ncbi:hypothetical protein SBBP2_890029 [Burkholderiales bacterium]|jgi:hypothetical protein|nr:hypothetical protein SBBP2_890029 [Burkholderiales bacterium]
MMRTTLASSDVEAVCNSVRHNTALSVEVASELVCRLRLALDQRSLAQRNHDAVRTILAGLSPSMDEGKLFRAVRSRLVRHASALGLDRVPSDPAIRHNVRKLIAETGTFGGIRSDIHASPLSNSTIATT